MVPLCNPPLVSQNAEFTPELSHFRASAALWSSGSSAAVTDLFEIGAKGIGSLHFSWTGFKLPRCSHFPVLSRLTHLLSQGKVHSQHTQNTKTRITMGLEQSPRKKGWFFFLFFYSFHKLGPVTICNSCWPKQHNFEVQRPTAQQHRKRCCELPEQGPKPSKVTTIYLWRHLLIHFSGLCDRACESTMEISATHLVLVYKKQFDGVCCPVLGSFV